MIKKNKTIGITTYLSQKDDDEFYHLNQVFVQNYKDLFAQYNLSVVIIVPEKQFLSHYLEICDGFIVSGNGKHIDPVLYGDTISSYIRNDQICKKRTYFEIDLAQQCVAHNIPYLGICGGMQVLNVATGGTLVQHIPSTYVESEILHQQSEPKRSPKHSVRIADNTKLSHIISLKNTYVNSFHLQSVKSVGDNMIINANSKDGVVEGIEHTKLQFCIGVQWHPEFRVTQCDFELFEAFSRAVRFS